MLIRKSNARPLYLCLFLFLLLAARVGYCGYTADCAQAPTWTTGSWTENDCLRFEKSLDETAGPARPDKISNSLLAVVPPSQYEGPHGPKTASTGRC